MQPFQQVLAEFKHFTVKTADFWENICFVFYKLTTYDSVSGVLF